MFDSDDEDNVDQRLVRTGPRIDSFDIEALEVLGAHRNDYEDVSVGKRILLAFQTLGIVFGDVGTSPLYTFNVMFRKAPINENEDILGALSLVLYTLILIPLVKYVIVVLWANDNGEGYKEKLVEIEIVEGLGPYSTSIKKVEKEIKDMAKKVNGLCGIKETDTDLVAPRQWDLVSDKQMMQEEQPLQVARCTKIINPNSEDAKYVINVKQVAKFVVGLGDKVSPTNIKEGMCVGYVSNK